MGPTQFPERMRDLRFGEFETAIALFWLSLSAGLSPGGFRVGSIHCDSITPTEDVMSYAEARAAYFSWGRYIPIGHSRRTRRRDGLMRIFAIYPEWRGRSALVARIFVAVGFVHGARLIPGARTTRTPPPTPSPTRPNPPAPNSPHLERVRY